MQVQDTGRVCGAEPKRNSESRCCSAAAADGAADRVRSGSANIWIWVRARVSLSSLPDSCVYVILYICNAYGWEPLPGSHAVLLSMAVIHQDLSAR